MPPDRFCLRPIDHTLQLFDARFPNLCQRAEMRQKLLRGLETDARDVRKLRRQRPTAAAFTMKGDGEAVAFIADLLNDAEHRRTAFENGGIIFAPDDIDDLLFFGDAGE